MREAIEESQRLTACFSVQAVPFFVFDRKYAVSGAQLAEVFLRVLGHAAWEQVAVS